MKKASLLLFGIVWCSILAVITWLFSCSSGVGKSDFPDPYGRWMMYTFFSGFWACYVGMGAAVLWDKSWGDYKDVEDWYTLMAKPRGFDCLDEYVIECLVGYKLDSEENKKLEAAIRKAANTAQTMIRKEGIEPQSVMAFHLFARVVKVFFRLGVSLELRRMGYKYVKVNLDVQGEAPIS